MCFPFNYQHEHHPKFESVWCTFDMQKGHLKLKSIVHLSMLNPFHLEQNSWFAWKFCGTFFYKEWNLVQKIDCHSHLLCLNGVWSKLQKCSLKKCPPIWVAPKIVNVPPCLNNLFSLFSFV
jgi:hypothetical protein